MVRLLEQRWTGHLNTTQVLHANFIDVIKALSCINGSLFSGKEICEARGILFTILRKSFVITLCYIKKLLLLIKPADKILQTREIGYFQATPVIDAVYNAVKDLKADSIFDSIVSESVIIFDKSKEIYTKHNPFDIVINEPNCEIELQKDFFQTITVLLEELENRFHNNNEYLNAIASVRDFDLKKLKCLERLGIKLPSIEELAVAKKYLYENCKDPQSVLKTLFKVRNAFSDTYSMFAAIETFGASTSINECSFSTLARLNTDHRRNMCHKRLASLIFLSFESKKTKNIEIEDIIKIFNDCKERRLRFYEK